MKGIRNEEVAEVCKKYLLHSGLHVAAYDAVSGRHVLARLELAFITRPKFLVVEGLSPSESQVIDIINADTFFEAVIEFIRKGYAERGYILLLPSGEAYSIKIIA